MCFWQMNFTNFSPSSCADIYLTDSIRTITIMTLTLRTILNRWIPYLKKTCKHRHTTSLTHSTNQPTRLTLVPPCKKLPTKTFRLNEKDICDCQNVSIKLAYVNLMFHSKISSLFWEEFLLFVLSVLQHFPFSSVSSDFFFYIFYIIDGQILE